MFPLAVLMLVAVDRRPATKAIRLSQTETSTEGRCPNGDQLRSQRRLVGDASAPAHTLARVRLGALPALPGNRRRPGLHQVVCCLLYTSDAADDLLCVDLGGRRII